MPTKCRYGESCYRKNPDHLRQFHSNSEDSADSDAPATSTTPEKENVKKAPVRNDKRKIDAAKPSTTQQHGTMDSFVKRKKEPEHKEETTTVEKNQVTASNDKTDDETKKTSTSAGSGKMVAELFPPSFVAAYRRIRADAKMSRKFDELLRERHAKFINLDRSGLNDDEMRVFWRFATDLPEMRTFFVDNSARYAVWRDDPDSTEFLVVRTISAERFPKIEVVGSSFDHFLVHVAEKVDVSSLLENTTVADAKKAMKLVVTQRNKKKVGTSPHAVGMYVPVKNDLGYRTTTDDYEKLKRELNFIATSTDAVAREKKLDKLSETVAYVQFANDECDFGMGLEFGHWLFMANTEHLDVLAHRILKGAYMLLKRNEYCKILDAQMARGRRADALL